MSNSIFSSGGSALAICDRCRMSYPYNYLRADGQSPGLQVCYDCWDHITPYALPPLQPDALVLRKPRAMVHLLAYQYQNLPVYEGGPVSIGEPSTWIPSFPDLYNAPYPRGYIPNTGSADYSASLPPDGDTDDDFDIPPFPPE